MGNQSVFFKIFIKHYVDGFKLYIYKYRKIVFKNYRILSFSNKKYVLHMLLTKKQKKLIYSMIIIIIIQILHVFQYSLKLIFSL